MIRYRTATLSDLACALDWAATEGWNPGLDDAAAFFAASSTGFFVATDDAGQPVASISVVNHTEAFAFLGLYIVRPAFRARGIGLGLWTHALGYAGDRTVGLDGVEAQQGNYAASGFVHAGATTRYTGKVAGRTDPAVRAIAPEDKRVLIDQEARASGVAKPAYLNAWFEDTRNRVTLISARLGGIDGFCTVRRCRTGAKIGPLVAATDAIGRGLIEHAATIFDGPLTLDVPQSSTALDGLCLRLGLTPGFRTARMYRGPFSPPSHKWFAVTSLELG